MCGLIPSVDVRVVGLLIKQFRQSVHLNKYTVKPLNNSYKHSHNTHCCETNLAGVIFDTVASKLP